jgi:hypothetical protein
MSCEAIVHGGIWLMRHITGLILALVLSAALFFGAGWGIATFSVMQAGRGTQAGSAWANTHNALPLTALVCAGLLIGVLLAVRAVSALATGLPGLAALGWSAFVLLRGRQALSYVPLSGSHVAVGFSTLLSTGTLALAGTAMIIPLFMPSRWRGHPAEVEELDDEYATQSALGLVP